MSDTIAAHVKTNYESFQQLLPTIVGEHLGQFALMRDGAIVQFYDSARDAFLVGQERYSDGKFSVQEVIDRPIDLGFFSHAVPER